MYQTSNQGPIRLQNKRPNLNCNHGQSTASSSIRAQPSSSPSVKTNSATLPEKYRKDFPILDQKINGKQLVYFDNAATSQTPTQVIDCLADYYNHYNANVHRGVHALAARATTRYEDSRKIMADFIGASSSQEVAFTKNCTEAINLVVRGWGDAHLKEGDEVLLSVAEHHSNLVPWELMAKRTGVNLKYVPLDAQQQQLDMQALTDMVGPRTKFISLCLASNVLGTTLPVHVVREAMKHAHPDCLLMVDACQAVPHKPIDVQMMGIDLLVGTGHKMCGPTGVGFLWGRYPVLETFQPFIGGGEMIDTVSITSPSTFASPPALFEAGTPAIAPVIALGEAAKYLSQVTMPAIQQYEHELAGLLYTELAAIPDISIYGPPPESGRSALCAYNIAGVHPTDLAMVLDTNGVAIRTGHHCTQPLHQALGIASSARASLYFYNTPAEVRVYVEALKDAIKFFKEME